jgi:hypothetical protein
VGRFFNPAVSAPVALACLLLGPEPSGAFWCCRHKSSDRQDPGFTTLAKAGWPRPPIASDVLSCTGTDYVPGKCVDMRWAQVPEAESTGCIHISLIGKDCADPVKQPRVEMKHMAHKWLYPAVRLPNGKFRRATSNDAFWEAFLPRAHFNPMPVDPD